MSIPTPTSSVTIYSAEIPIPSKKSTEGFYVYPKIIKQYEY